MRLLIDYGNTLIKIALYRDDELLDAQMFKEISAGRLKQLVGEIETKHNFDDSIHEVLLSAVKDIPEDLYSFLSDSFDFYRLDHKTPVPIRIKYDTPETLGHDRIALAVAGSGLFPNENVLVIDAGTCITYDFINKNKEYLGGGISPGILMRFRALHNFTGKLPLIKHFEDTGLLGSTTKNSIVSGVLNGVRAEVDNIIDRYINEYSVSRVLFTGGDMIYFDKKLKNNIFANSNLVFVGLNMILNYNVGH
jgi:type III pantothenate kinase